MELAQIVRHGSITIIARNFGVTRKSIGWIAIVSRASISSETFIVPISAANADPARPLTTQGGDKGEIRSAAGKRSQPSQIREAVCDGSSDLRCQFHDLHGQLSNPRVPRPVLRCP